MYGPQWMHQLSEELLEAREDGDRENANQPETL